MLGRLAIFLTVVGFLAGCQHARQPPPPEGHSAFKFVDPAQPPPSRRKTGEGEMAQPREPILFTRASPIGTPALPVYPAVALAGRAGLAVVGVRLMIGVDGRVTDVASNFTTFSTPGPFAAEFRAAVEAAVAQWRFTPAEIKVLETVEYPGGEYQRLKSRENVESTADVSFTFSATGEVIGRTK